MFGIIHGELQGDKRDGEFVAARLRELRGRGFRYVAVEASASLNRALRRHDFEGEAEKIFGGHWTEFGPVIQEARKLKMKLVFYDVENDWQGSDAEREAHAFKNLRGIVFDQDPAAKLVIYSGGKHMYTEPVERDFLHPEKIKWLGAFLYERFGKQLLTVLLQPKKPGIRGYSFDHQFYLGKQCP